MTTPSSATAFALPFGLQPAASKLPTTSQLQASRSSSSGRTPTQVLLDNSNDRPDIFLIAVLGYN